MGTAWHKVATQRRETDGVNNKSPRGAAEFRRRPQMPPPRCPGRRRHVCPGWGRSKLARCFNRELLGATYVIAAASLFCIRPDGTAALPSTWHDIFVSWGYLLQDMSLVPYEIALGVLLCQIWRERAGPRRGKLAFIIASMVVIDRLVAISGGRFH